MVISSILIIIMKMLLSKIKNKLLAFWYKGNLIFFHFAQVIVNTMNVVSLTSNISLTTHPSLKCKD